MYRPRVIRKKLKLTQEQVAERIGVHKNTISNWESGKIIPPKNKRKEIEEVYGVPFEQIEWSNEW